MNRTLFSAALAAFAVVVSTATPALSAPSHEQNMAYVAALYRDVLQRSPGYDGLGAWVPGLDNGSKSRVDVAREFIKSDEYRRIRVRDMFSAYMHRGMTDADLANFVRNGGSLRSLRVSLLASQEYFSLHGSNARGWLNGLFRDMLGRSPGYGGVETWVQQINQGKNRTEIVNEIYGSPEALGRIVDSLYGAFLKRAADPSGKAQNVQAMQRGTTEEDIAAGLLTTAEYYNRNQTGNGIIGNPPFGFGGNNNNGNYGLQQGDSAQFVNQNVPNGMIAGQTYYVSVTMRNTGRTQWDPNSYALNVYPDGTPTWSTIAIAMPAPVNPGNAVTFTFNVIAPQSPGTYDFRWQLRRAGVGFFGDVTQDISVTVSAGRTF